MGPEATADLYMKIVKIFQNEYGAQFDSDYPQIIINSIPLPDVVNVEETNEIYPYLENGVKTLENAGVDFIVIPCNTVQFLLEKLRKVSKVPIIGIPEEMVKVTKSFGLKRVGLLSTRNTIKLGVFDAIEKTGTVVIKPDIDQQNQITNIIMEIMKGNKLERGRLVLERIISDFVSKGADGIILGCTELPLIINNNDKVLLLDTTEILAQASVRKVFGE